MALSVDASQVDITNKKHLEELINEIEVEQNVQRKRDAFTAFEVLEGGQLPHTEKRLAELYPTTHKKFRVGDISIPKKVITKKNKAYSNSPIRKLKSTTDTDTLNEVYNEFLFDRSFKEADKIFNYHKYVAMWLTYINPKDDNDELEGKYKLHALAPYEYDLVRDEVTGEPLIFIFSYGDTDITGGADGVEQTITESQRDTSAESKVYSIWNETHFVKIRVKSKNKSGSRDIDFIKITRNPIDKLPIVFLSSDLAVDYPVPSNLHRQSIEWNLSLSDLKTSACTQGHGQLVISKPSSLDMETYHMGMHTAITLDQSKDERDKPTTAEYISASPDLEGQLSVLKFDLLNILDEQGITSKSAIEGGAEDVKSGFDRLIKEADVQDIITSNQALYADTLEQGVFDIFMAYEAELNNTRIINEELEVYFEKSTVMISDKETLENIKLRDELGLILDYEKHMIINPNLTDINAKKREEEIQAQKEVQAEKMRKVLGSEEPSEDDEDSEDEVPPKEE
jgi:hypothetical protein